VSLFGLPQVFYYLFFFLKRRHWKEAKTLRRVAVLIPAHNEGSVIFETVKYMKTKMNYPSDRYQIYICAHNCTDNTAEEAKRAGGIVFVYNDPDPKHRKAAYPLQYGFRQVLKADKDAEIFIHFDADNIPCPDYFRHMNNSVEEGAKIIRSYEASSNLKQNVWTETSALFSLKDSRMSNTFRQAVKANCMAPGPGITMVREVVERMDGWDCMSNCDDAEFAVKRSWDGYKLDFNTDAIVYEDQPSSFHDTFARLSRMGNGSSKVFFTQGWKMILCFFRTLNPMYLDNLVQVGYSTLSVVCMIWFPLYYSAYAICMLLQLSGIPVFTLNYFQAVSPNYLISGLSEAELSMYCGRQSMFDLLIMAAKVISITSLIAIIQTWLVLFLDRKKLGLDNKLSGLWKAILLNPFFSVVYGFCSAIGTISHAKWKSVARNPSDTVILLPQEEKKPAKIWYMTIKPYEKKIFNGQWNRKNRS
jgi:cellulose synthase/poly-beta-1,6-N-acetylglucosamine synthase-like glycosyltransferase